MSPALASSDFALPIRSSRSLRSCRIACAFDWSFQKSGALVFSSKDAICCSADGASKIAPDECDALVEFEVSLLEVFDLHGQNSTSEPPIRKAAGASPLPPQPPGELNGRFRNVSAKSAIEAATHTHASQSPNRT